MAQIIDKDMFEGIVNENLDLKKQLQQLETKGNTVSKIKHGKLKEDFEAFRTKYIENEKLLNAIRADYLKLSDEHTKLLVTGTVSKAEFDREQQQKEQYQRLFEKEKEKRTKQTDFDTLTARIKDLEEQLMQEQEKHSRKGTGRPRKGTTVDEEIVRLREEGKTVRAIADTTKISKATINRILKQSKSK